MERPGDLEHEVLRNACVARVVRLLTKPCVRCIVGILWFGLVTIGAIVTPDAVKSMTTIVPPVKGTASYDASKAMQLYFPDVPLSNAVLVESLTNAPLLWFKEASTCRLRPSIKNTSDNLQLHTKCQSPNALGGGCLTSNDFIDQVGNLTKEALDRTGWPVQDVNKILEQMGTQIKNRIKFNISECPVATDLTPKWSALAANLTTGLFGRFDNCMSQVLSFNSLPAQNLSIFQGKVDNYTLNISIEIPAGLMWSILKKQLLAASETKMLIAVATSCASGFIDPGSDVAKAVLKAVEDVVAAGVSPNVRTRVSSQASMMESILDGVQETMGVSTKTLPAALLILAVMVGNLRLVICTVVNLIGCILLSMLLVWPMTKAYHVSTSAPSMMIAVALGMSIDYSLFLLTRFQKEMLSGRSPGKSVEIMLCTSGKIILISGLTLLLCFLMMLYLPAEFIANLGISSALTVFSSILAALTITPVMLLSCPYFFGNNKCWGLSFGGCGCCCRCFRRRGARTSLDSEDQLSVQFAPGSIETLSHTEALNRRMEKSCWPKFASAVQRLALPIFIVLVSIAVPFGYFSVPKMTYSAGLIPFMPTNAEATKTIQVLQDAFGVGAIFPTTLLVIPPEEETETPEKLARWLIRACKALQEMATTVNATRESGSPPFTASAFMGPMIVGGQCIPMMGMSQWSNVSHFYSATQVQITYPIDPFTSEGQAWVSNMRDAFAKHSDVATWHLQGAGPEQMDAAHETFNAFPFMLGLMMIVVLVLIGISFRSLIAPLRAVFCILWMLVMTFGLAVYVFQDGWFDFLGWEQLGSRSTGSMSWVSPCVSCSIIVGLGLDYDIFYSECVLEECEHGHSDTDAAVRALSETANTISAAGLIMAMAFGALLLSSTPMLNELSFLLVLGVLIDCFISTKIIMPAAMKLLGNRNFWPHKFPRRCQQRSGIENAT